MGEATTKEKTFVEESLQNKEFADEYWITEDDLVSDYISDSLTPQERKLFEANYLVSNEHKEKRELKEITLAVLKETSYEKRIPAEKNEKVSALYGFFQRFPRLALPSLAVLMFGLVVALLVIYFRQESKIRSLETSLEQSRNKLSKSSDNNQINRIIKTTEENSEEEETETEEIDEPSEQYSDSQNRQSKDLQAALRKDRESRIPPDKTEKDIADQLYPVFSVQPLRGQMGTGVKPTEIVVSKKAKMITFNFVLSTDKDYKAYKTDIAGMIFEEQIKSSQKKVAFKISPENLGTGKVTITLFGIDQSGKEREVTIYQINVKNP